MADNVAVTAGTGTSIAADEVVDGTLGTVKVQYVKIMDGALDGTAKLGVGANGIKVDPSAVTSPISAASLPLPALAATSTKQSDGSQKTQVVDGSGNVMPSGDTVARAMFEKITDGTNTAAVKAASTAPAATDPALVVAVSPNSWDTGSGTSGTKTQRVILDSSQFSALGQTTMAASAPVVIASDQSAIPAIAKPTATANGQTSSRVNAAASTNATSLKASAGQVGEVDVFNVAAYTVFLKFYNKASAPTVGTDTPVWTIPVQAGGGYAKSFPRGKTFATGIAYAITKLQADSDTTVVAAGDLTGSIDWI